MKTDISPRQKSSSTGRTKTDIILLAVLYIYIHLYLHTCSHWCEYVCIIIGLKSTSKINYDRVRFNSFSTEIDFRRQIIVNRRLDKRTLWGKM